jgi:hypothetical protein
VQPYEISTDRAPETPSGKESAPLVICSGGWCVDFGTSQVTHNGQGVPNIECLENTICAGIVGQHHAAKATLDGSIAFGKFKLSAAGAISNSEGEEVANCSEMGGIDHKCVANFLRKMFAGVSEGKEDLSGPEKATSSKEQIRKTESKKTESKKRRTAKASSGSKKGSAADQSVSSLSGGDDKPAEQHETETKMNEAAWDDANRRGF